MEKLARASTEASVETNMEASVEAYSQGHPRNFLWGDMCFNTQTFFFIWGAHHYLRMIRWTLPAERRHCPHREAACPLASLEHCRNKFAPSLVMNIFDFLYILWMYRPPVFFSFSSCGLAKGVNHDKRDEIISKWVSLGRFSFPFLSFSFSGLSQLEGGDTVIAGRVHQQLVSLV